MILFGFRNIWLFLLIFGQTTGISYNQPKLCANATWNQTAITFVPSPTVGTYPLGMFVDRNNSVYVADQTNGRIQVWLNGSTTLTGNYSGGLSWPYSVFVTDNGDVYVDNGYTYYRVDKWGWNSTNSVPAIYVCGQCYGLFVDINNMLYCVMGPYHQVVSKSLDSRLNVWNIVAGTGTAGSTSVTLNTPWGIFVDINLSLYVADTLNNRIQKFASGQSNGTTIATGAIVLYAPTSVIFDADGYMFISDCWNHRLIGSGPNGFRCIAACFGYGSSSSQLYYPHTMSFDSYGNIFVTDEYNNRIQKFLLLPNSCNGTTIVTTMATVTSMNNTQLVSLTTTAPGISSTTVPYLNPISYNMPKFTAYTTWSSNGITFADTTVVGTYPYGVFVDNNNTVYVSEYSLNRVQVWREGSSKPTRNISGNLNAPCSVFVTSNGDIYVDNGNSNSRVDKWTINATNSTVVMNVKSYCCGLFIDINNNLYCTMYGYHQVNTKPLNSNSSISTIAAGTGCAGATSNTLHDPRGIFVDTDLNLYVADFTNNRIQKFLSEQVNGITIAGTGATGTISLSGPCGIALDADGYVFITDYYNNRIVGSGPNGFRCLLGCTSAADSASNHLYYPTSLSFDSYDLTANQPNLCPSTTWYTNAITVANITTIGYEPFGLFVSTSNTLYVADSQNSRVQRWLEGSVNPDKTISGGLYQPAGIFATASGDIYVDNGASNGRVDKWSVNANSSIPFMTVPNACGSIFIDIENTLYCSASSSHQVVKKWLYDNMTTSTIVAGTGTAGSAANMFNLPYGVFVDVDINLYVADCQNNRVQFFPLGQSNGITVAGSGAPSTISLVCPDGITLDANSYLFIVDQNNQRIVGSGPYGFRCLFGCTSVAGSASNQVYYPRSISFDSYGNIFIADQYNSRIQKFVVASNSCSLSYSQPTFCSNATWSVNAVTFASSSTIGLLPYGIFIDGINTVYVPNRVTNTILSWPQWSTSSTSKSYTNLSNPFSLFMSINGDTYIDNGYLYGRVDKYTFNTSNRVTVMNINGSCYGLFIDTSNNLYCSLKNLHQVVKLLLNNGTTIPTIAAGNGSAGSLSTMLNSPQGIYVDSNLNLYIADCANNRIQFVQTGQLNGVTIAGNGSSANIILNYPTGIVLDSNGYLFIVDSYNHRIVASSYYGFRCIVGCSGGGSSASQLSFPQSMAFDSYGNMYVTDRNNSRVQQFTLQNNSCTAAVPQLALLLPSLARLQAVAVPRVPLPVPPVALLLLQPVPQVALPLAVLLRAVAVPPAARLLRPPVRQVVLPLPPPVPQAAVLQVVPLLPPVVPLQAVAVAQVAARRVVAVLQVARPRAAAVPQVALLLRPPVPVPLRAAVVLQVALLLQLPPVVPQVALLLPLVLQQVAAVPQVALLPRPPLVVPLRAVAALQVAVRRVVAVLQVVLLQAAAVPQVALLLPPPPPQALQQVAAVLQVALLLPLALQQVAAVPQVAVQRVVAVLQVVLPRAALVLQVALLPRSPLVVRLRAVAAPQVAVLQVVLPPPPPPVVHQVAPLPLAVLLRVVVALQAAVQQVVAVLQVVLPQVPAVSQVALLPPPQVLQRAVAKPQVVLPLPLAVPQVARLPSQLLKD
ncbi:unnamed protein product [Adineta steineri]|uniref:NHL repeat containing protein-like protein n=1 Tax=Adineta steineri TaxID=433720 RepID=A0A819SU13_9BILA|nr:unnamed protein product [Adineta steineri]